MKSIRYNSKSSPGEGKPEQTKLRSIDQHRYLSSLTHSLHAQRLEQGVCLYRLNLDSVNFRCAATHSRSENSQSFLSATLVY
ncbi:MAG: hypothetical protein RL392_22 [Pseudomonadota bacterium]|jgi:hypothetical protein